MGKKMNIPQSNNPNVETMHNKLKGVLGSLLVPPLGDTVGHRLVFKKWKYPFYFSTRDQDIVVI